MRRIKFDEATVSQIRGYIEAGHTMEETCNRFTLKYDTLRRVMHEHGILPYHREKRTTAKDIDDSVKSQVVNLFASTNIRMQDIVKETNTEYYIVKEIIDENFSEEYQNRRRSRIYRQSKFGENIPMSDKCGAEHHNYKGLVDDGNGYYMIHKPDWYTGRRGSDYVFYHSVVMCEALGLTEIPKGYVVHHIDFDKHNNDISNLSLMTISAHAKLHNIMRNLCKVQRLSVQE